MRHTTLIDARALAGLLAAPHSDLLVCDCRFDLSPSGRCQVDYRQAHVPGALYVDLEVELCGPRTGCNGRHPLPDQEAFAAWFAEIGGNADTQVIAYDAVGGGHAARLWWMLRWIGHRSAAVLDGGIQGWHEAGLPLAQSPPVLRARGNAHLRPTLCNVADHERVRQLVFTGSGVILDARSGAGSRRFSSVGETVAGHIPGSIHRHFADNLDRHGRFKPARTLAREFETLLGEQNASRIVSYSGSGVTSCHHLLALEIAGLQGAALYPGSWSEWIARPGAPIERGARSRFLPGRVLATGGLS